MLLASGTLFAWAHLPRLAHAGGRDPRFLAVILRGALDELATVAPVGDPNWVSLRGDNALTLDSKVPALKLNDFFGLNPAMPNLHRMFTAKEAIIVRAAATPYRERSHFDGQDLLESVLPKGGRSKMAAIEHTDDMGQNMGQAPGQKPPAPGPAQVRAYFAEAAGNAAKFLAQPDGPRVGALPLDGWDTHFNEGIASGQLSLRLGALDGALGVIETREQPGARLSWCWSPSSAAPRGSTARRYRSRHSDGRAAGRRCAERRPRHRRLAWVEARGPL